MCVILALRQLRQEDGWRVPGQPELHSKTLSQKTRKENSNNKENRNIL
jgi:hypothetical protein